MQHNITAHTMRVVMHRDFDYLRAGDELRATPYDDNSGTRLDLEDQSAGTFLHPHQWSWLAANPSVATVTPYGR